jgi:hypothetical protein
MGRMICSLLFSIAIVAGEAAEEPRLADDTAAHFAAPDEGRTILASDDAFTASLSRFDRQCRMKTDKDVTLSDWKAFVVQHVLAWEPTEVERVSQSLARLKRRLADYQLPLPPVVRLVRTTGDEESGAAYTRGSSIVLPSKVMKYDDTQLDRLLLHELFHVLSRHDGAVRARLYGIIGFELCQPIELPRMLAPRRITNPDAPLVDCTISLPAADGKAYIGAPVLYSSANTYDAKRAPTLFQSLVFRLLVVERRGGRYEPLLVKGEPVVIDPKKEPAFLDKVGKNTNYIIHPDEIMADNFVRLVMQDADVPTPRIIEEMRRVLSKR